MRYDEGLESVDDATGLAATADPAPFDWTERDRREHNDRGDKAASAEAHALKPIDATLASEAVSIVTTSRQENYAHPTINFQRIADLWSPVFNQKVTPAQVGLAMILLKVAREINRHTRDNMVDLIGYTLTLDALYPDTK